MLNSTIQRPTIHNNFRAPPYSLFDMFYYIVFFCHLLSFFGAAGFAGAEDAAGAAFGEAPGAGAVLGADPSAAAFLSAGV